MRNEHARNIEARELHAVLKLAYLLKHAGGDTLRGFATGVAGEHTVDVRVVKAPESSADVRAVAVYGRNYEYLPVV